jgi:hypothetical protein
MPSSKVSITTTTAGDMPAGAASGFDIRQG